MNWPDAELNEIRSRGDLALYLQGLAQRLHDGELQSENLATADFVDAAGRWTKAMEGFFKNVVRQPVPEDPDWAMIAAIFRAAVVYE
ncbi:hypothetical protein KGA66_25590 [Actinocrinis puniceicyclus]|uniref:DUF7660 domain-containing protein n=1 Tax=Actinocrinis puniceicyclus TaxID=977794 RepID=A0A8J7WTF9_9ACTN|nr:hypothetical protein [Actinocrinis puniceicyclus]MBS2966440.1 hypothetical protein [Actinocrinis puniceicyclus]